MSSDSSLIISIFTPYQLFIAEKLVESRFPGQPVYLVDQRSAKAKVVRRAKFATLMGVCELDIPNNTQTVGAQKDVSRAVDFAVAACGDGSALFLCANLHWDLNNVLFTVLRRRPEPVRCELFEDGISTYLMAPMTWQRVVRNVAKIAIGKIKGWHPHSLPAADANGFGTEGVSALYVMTPDVMSIRSPKIQKFEVSMPEARPKLSNVAIFLGQPYSKTYGEVYHRFLREIIDRRAELGADHWAYKPHHFSSPEEMAVFLDAGFDLCNPSIGLEEALCDTEAGLIVSINSTALVTAKLLLGNKIRCVAVSPNLFCPWEERRNSAELIDLFRRFGVEIWDMYEEGRRHGHGQWSGERSGR